MISLQKIKSSGVASKYFEEADYYSKGESDDSDIQSEWSGKGASSLGLEGKVDIQDFKNALDGKIAGVEIGRPAGNGDKEHTKGWDVTFSAPKSVSILALAGGDKRLLEAHRTAVKTALGFVEKELITTRETKDGNTLNIKTGNLAAASFTHTTSRDLDPQLHTHNVVLNITRRADGELRSLDSRTIYDSSMLAGQVYRSELAKQVKELGYQISSDAKKGFFEISSVPKEVITNFSKRRQAIEKAAKERDIKTTKGMQAAALATRKSKQKSSPELLIKQWDDELSALGYDPEKSINESKQNIQEHTHSTPEQDAVTEPTNNSDRTATKDQSVADHSLALDSVRFAYKHLAEKEAVFTKPDVLSLALKVSMGKAGFNDIERSLNSLIENKEVVRSHLQGGQGLTTRAALKTEKFTIDLMKHGQNEVSAIARVGLISDHLRDKGLEVDQANAVHTVLSSKDRVVGVQGYAGTGKTYMLKQVREIAEAKGYRLQGAAFSASAASELEQGSGITSQTLASFINDKESELVKGKLKGKKDLWVVDEASLVNAKDMASLLTLSRKARSRVVLVGDKAQIGAIEWGKPFHQLMDNGMKHAEMKTIRRQRSTDLLRAVKGMINKTPMQALSAIKNDIKVVADQEERIKAMAEDYLKLSPEERKRMLIVIPDNETRKAVMSLIREGLQKEGRIGNNEISTSVFINRGLSRAEKSRAQFYEKGNVVEFGKDQKRLGVKRNERFVVERITSDTVILKSEKKTISWQPGKVAGSARNGVEVYRQDSRSFGVGDNVRWKKNLPDQGLKNGDTGKVISIDGSKMNVAFKNGTKTIDTKTGKHIDHNYAVTAFASQGMTFDKVAVMAESWRKNLINQASFYVGISRAKDKAMIYTDDQQKLSKAISERTGEKTSAIQTISPDRQVIDKDGFIDVMKDKAIEAGNKIKTKVRDLKLEIDF